MSNDEKRRQTIREAAAMAGLAIEPHGRAGWRIRGSNGIDIVTTDLAQVQLWELRAPKPGRPWRSQGPTAGQGTVKTRGDR